jgi:DNA-binding protein YbaB
MIDKEDLEDLLTVSLAKALEKAEEINQLEMSKSTSPFLPNF